MLGPLFIVTLLSSNITTDRFSVSRDLLPFGVPTEFADERGPILSLEELAGCLQSYLAVERTRLKLDLKYVELRIEESHGVLNKSIRSKNVPSDELDQQLDDIERSLIEESSLTKNTEQLLLERTKFFRAYAEFSKSCGVGTYRASDVRTIFPNGIPKQ